MFIVYCGNNFCFILNSKWVFCFPINLYIYNFYGTGGCNCCLDLMEGTGIMTTSENAALLEGGGGCGRGVGGGSAPSRGRPGEAVGGG